MRKKLFVKGNQRGKKTEGCAEAISQALSILTKLSKVITGSPSEAKKLTHDEGPWGPPHLGLGISIFAEVTIGLQGEGVPH